MSHPSLQREPAAGRLSLRRLAILVGVAVPVLLVLWWCDPRQVGVPTCGLYLATGLHCPGCGATRATHELLNGRLLSALSYNAMWIVLLPAALYAGLSEACRFVRGRSLPGNPFGRPWFLAVVVAIAIVFGVLRNLPWEPFCSLAPPG